MPVRARRGLRAAPEMRAFRCATACVHMCTLAAIATTAVAKNRAASALHGSTKLPYVFGIGPGSTGTHTITRILEDDFGE